MCASSRGRSLPETTEELLDIVLERAGGSPLFAEQLGAMLSDTALPIAGGAIDALLIPPTVQALIAARIDALPAEPKQVLMEASVVGKTFWSGAIAALGRHDDLPRSFAELERREFVRHARLSTMGDEDEYDFWHALVRDVAYAQLTRAERARMHTSVARWIAARTDGSLGEDAEIVVHHLECRARTWSVTGRRARAVPDGIARCRARDVAHRRGSRRRRVGANPDGASRGGSRYTEVTVGLGRALASLGRYREAAEMLESGLREALAAADTEPAVDVAIDLESMLWQLGEEDRDRLIMDDVRKRFSGAETPALVKLLSRDAMVAAVDRRYEASRTLVDRVFAVAKTLEVAVPARAIGALGLIQFSEGDERGRQRAVRRPTRSSWRATSGARRALSSTSGPTSARRIDARSRGLR